MWAVCWAQKAGILASRACKQKGLLFVADLKRGQVDDGADVGGAEDAFAAASSEIRNQEPVQDFVGYVAHLDWKQRLFPFDRHLFGICIKLLPLRRQLQGAAVGKRGGDRSAQGIERMPC